MIKLSLQSDIDERTEMALDMLHQMHDDGIIVHIYAKQDGVIHIDQLKAEAESLGYEFSDGDIFYVFTKHNLINDIFTVL